MQRVIGIGGVFFRSKHPLALGQWYKKHLGIDLAPTDEGQTPWAQEAGPTVIAPFPENTEYFGKKEQGWMINFRVRNLEAMAKQLRDLGLDVEVDPEVYPNGRFARLYDPEGNPIELWEPYGKL
jgi:predicted enzyme related to lactoylglutathione lyase